MHLNLFETVRVNALIILICLSEIPSEMSLYLNGLSHILVILIILIRGGRTQVQLLQSTAHILLQVSKNLDLGANIEKRNIYMCTVYKAFVHNRS